MRFAHEIALVHFLQRSGNMKLLFPPHYCRGTLAHSTWLAWSQKNPVDSAAHVRASTPHTQGAQMKEEHAFAHTAQPNSSELKEHSAQATLKTCQNLPAQLPHCNASTAFLPASGTAQDGHACLCTNAASAPMV